MKNLNWLRDSDKIPLVICPSRKFLYFRLHKVAGTSIYRGIMEKQLTDAWVKKTYPKQFARWFAEATLEDFKEYFKFVIVRNPYSHAVSNYVYLSKHYKRKEPFKRFLSRIIAGTEDYRFKAHVAEQHHCYLHEGEPFYDFMGRLENLKNDWPVVARRIGLPDALPKKNRSGAKHYSHYYDKDTKEMVEQIYRKDLEYLQYKFEEK